MAFTYITTAGDFGWRGDGYSHSLVFDVTLTEKLYYILQSDLVTTNDHDNSPATPGRDDNVGINQYLIYDINDCVAAGTRLQWWKNEGQSQYASTWGLNIKSIKNLIFRPEIQHDWGSLHPSGTRRPLASMGSCLGEQRRFLPDS